MKTTESPPTSPSITNHSDIRKRFLALGEQQDAHEFFVYVVERIEKIVLEASKFRKSNLLEGSRQKSFVVSQSLNDISYDSDSLDRWKHMPLLGKMDSTLICISCQSRWSNSQLITNLSLYPPHRGNCTVNDCLAAFTMSEKVDDVYCPKCKTKRNVEKRLTLSKTPDILCLHFNRLSFGRSPRKISTNISFERNLNITFVTNPTISLKYEVDIENVPKIPLTTIEKTIPLGVKKSGRSKKLSTKQMNGHFKSINGDLNHYENGLVPHMNGSTSYKSSGRSSPMSSDTSSLSSTRSDYSYPIPIQRPQSPYFEVEENEYVLTSVVVHLGDHKGGHYVCYRATDPLENGSAPWLYMSDSSLKLVGFDDVKQQEAFMLFYQKRHNF